MREDKFSDRERILAIGLCLPQRQPAEVCDHQGVDDQGSNPLGAEKRKEIEVVATGGFHGDHGIAQSDTVRGDCFEEFGKPARVIPVVREKAVAPCASRPATEKESLETSIPTKRVCIGSPPWYD